MPKTLTATSIAISQGLTALTPRQVLLANPKMISVKPSALSKEDRTLLLLSIAQYLQKSGFVKTLKKFRSEAQLEEDGWKGSKLDLEEMCLKFLDKGNNVTTRSSGLDQDGKKKKSKKDSDNVVSDASGDAGKPVHKSESVKEKKAKKNFVTLTKESQEIQSGESKEPGNDAASELQHYEVEKKRKDKKKKDQKSVPDSVTKEENQRIETIPEHANSGKSEDLTTSEGKNDAVSEVEKKSKDRKKKKSRSTSDEVANDDEKQDPEKSKSLVMDIKKAENQQVETSPGHADGRKSEDLTTSKEKNDAPSVVENKSKDKKKKKSKSTCDEVANDVEKQDPEKSKSLMTNIKKAGSEGNNINSLINKEAKPQKRKRLESENDSQSIDKEPLEKSKRRKKENRDSRTNEQKSEVKASQNCEVDLLESQKTPTELLDGKENGNLVNTAEKSVTGKDTKKRNGSAEPQSTTAKAFQRIKVDEVVFSDEKLKDNSYWAKDGAENGYGAKAEGVLGQVRGKDFRHEKTKKKRGSYRGGQIDLQSHSVKFNYSDDE